MKELSHSYIASILENNGLLNSVRYRKYDPDGKGTVKDLITDSRSLYDPMATMFAAIKTSLDDGHRFIEDLYSRHVGAFMVEKLPKNFDMMPEATFFEVKSVRQALAMLVYSQTRGAVCNSVIITGSYGKTTVKELIYRSLLPTSRAVRSPRSWNSSIGVPLSLWNNLVRETDPDYVITETGIDGPDQAEYITGMLGTLGRIGVLTPITDEHDEAFGSHEDKIREKVRLFANCTDIVFCDSDPAVEEIVRENAAPYCRLHRVSSDTYPDTGSLLRSLALATLRILGADAVRPGLPEVSARIDISAGQGDSLIIYDYFTADSDSLRDTLDFMRRRDTGNRRPLLLLGNLSHSGLMSDSEIKSMYTDACRMAHIFGCDDIIAIGDEVSANMQGLAVEQYNSVDSFLSKKSPAAFAGRTIILKGLSTDGFDILRNSLESVWHDTRFEVDLGALAHNFNHYRSLVPASTGIVCMVKASAYGMGAVEVAKTLQSRGAAYLAVAVVDEAVTLRDAGVTMPIMVMNPVTNRFQALFEQRIEPVVFSLDELDRLIDEAENYGTCHFPIHIKLDTGMHRVGFLKESLNALAQKLHATQSVHVESVFSHLATADCLDMDGYTRGQIDTFYEMTELLRDCLGYDFKRHLLNTAGMMRFSDCGDYEMARLGIGLYGVSPYPTPEATRLRPVASLYSTIISLKKWPAGTPIGYGCRSVTTRESIIATIPVGYADGINRHFGRGNASFIVNGAKCPTIGNICMDQCMIDVTDAPDVKVNDTVEIFGPNQPVERLAEALDTIPYEILTSVSPRVKRVYHN